MRIYRVALPQSRQPHWAVEDGDEFRLLRESPFEGGPLRLAGESWSKKKARVFAPVGPSKIVCVGRNYRAHAEELDHEVPLEPLIFLKPPTAIVGPGTPICIPPDSELVHHEGELAVVVGRMLRHASEMEAVGAIFGYACANDITARDIQRKEGKFTRAKGYDTFCPLGPALVSADEISEPDDLSLTVRVDGEVRQQGNTRDMVFAVPKLLSFISHIMTLVPGDVVLTGTPAGVGKLEAGQVVEVEITGVGLLENPVQAG
jgi:2-keto-4-pentenoate hydratase/2-oxohepta-3-ene-1,7-dioic acid hydratase in catechol pathway